MSRNNGEAFGNADEKLAAYVRMQRDGVREVSATQDSFIVIQKTDGSLTLMITPKGVYDARALKFLNEKKPLDPNYEINPGDLINLARELGIVTDLSPKCLSEILKANKNVFKDTNAFVDGKKNINLPSEQIKIPFVCKPVAVEYKQRVIKEPSLMDNAYQRVVVQPVVKIHDWYDKNYWNNFFILGGFSSVMITTIIFAQIWRSARREERERIARAAKRREKVDREHLVQIKTKDLQVMLDNAVEQLKKKQHDDEEWGRIHRLKEASLVGQEISARDLLWLRAKFPDRAETVDSVKIWSRMLQAIRKKMTPEEFGDAIRQHEIDKAYAVAGPKLGEALGLKDLASEAGTKITNYLWQIVSKATHADDATPADVATKAASTTATEDSSADEVNALMKIFEQVSEDKK